MTEGDLKELYQKSRQSSLAPEIEARIGGPTLKLGSLKFLSDLFRELKPKNVLEFGSGLSTKLFVDILSADDDFRIYSVDNSKKYLVETMSRVEKKQRLVPLHAPLSFYWHRGRSFMTYSNECLKKIPAEIQFDLILVDGPLGFFQREAPLYQVLKHLKPGTVVLLDDSHREYEQETLKQWQNYWPNLTLVDLGNDEPLTVLVLNDPRQTASSPWPLSSAIKSHVKSLRRWIFLQKHRLQGNSYEL